LCGWAEKWDGASNEWLVLAALDSVEAWACGKPQQGRLVLPLVSLTGTTEYARQTLEAHERHRDFRAKPHRIDLSESDIDAERTMLGTVMRQYRFWRKLLRKQTGIRAPRKISESDLQRTVRYHFGKQTFGAIAAGEGRRGKDASDVVKRSVLKTETELQLRLRERDKPGRPRKQQSENEGN
jgi:hypothetical protein